MGKKYTNDARERYYQTYNNARIQAQNEGVEFVEPSFADTTKTLLEVDTLASVYSLTDKVLTKSNPTVYLTDSTELTVPAMNDGKDIFISTRGYGDRVNNMDIAMFHGLNYHEVAHLLYSPRQGAELGKWLKDNDDYLRAFNILEDGRIEVLLTHKHPSVIPFLTNAVVKQLVKNIEPENFVITRGRRYLPIEVRRLFAGLAVQKFGKDKVRALADCIDEFRLLNIFQQPDKAKEIIIRFASLIEDMTPPASPNGCGKPVKDEWGRTREKARPVMKAGRTETPKNIQELLDQITKSDSNAEDLENLEGWDKPEDGEQQDGEQQDGEQQDGKQQSQQEGSTQRERERQIMEQSVSNAEGDQSISNEVSRVRKVVRESVGKAVVNNIKKNNSPTFPVQQTARVSAIKFARELEQLQQQTDPSWVVEQPSGRVNIQRYMRRDPNGLNKIFDRWSEGNYSHEIESVVLTDCSGSMGSVMQQANEATWIIKRALESIQGSVTSYAFNESPKLIYTADERTSANAYRNPQSSGGTNPLDCLLAAQRIFMGSQKTTKLLFMVTDGMWSNAQQCDSLLREMEKEGVVTILIYLGNPYWRRGQNGSPINIKSSWYDYCTDPADREKAYAYSMKNEFHDAQIKHYLTDAKDIVEVAKAVANTQIKAAM